ncbi:MAG: DUF2948 family protein [Pseudomonadota bacterium]
MTRARFLKLRARDAADLAVIAACLQDALVRPRDMTFLAGERRFAFVANRFRWEAAAAGGRPDEAPVPADAGDAEFREAEAQRAAYERIHCGVCFDRVRAVKTRGLAQGRNPEFLELLTIHAKDGAILLVFAGDAMVRLEVDAIRCHLDDLGEPWPTAWRPDHPLELSEKPDGKEPA